MSCEETVTIKLETYNEMKYELERLRKEVQEKTIIKKVLPPIYGYVAMAIFVAIFIWQLHF
jgi:hypothetical protein